MSLQKKNQENGFTLIELIVSIGILAILSVFIMTTINPYDQFLKAQDARRKSDLAQIQKALEAYYQDTGKYPSSKNGSTPIYKIVTVESPPDNVKDWGTAWTPYIQILPKDIGNRRYVYVGSDDGQSYRLYTSLQRGSKDPQACNNGLACSGVPAEVYCDITNTSSICNYGVSSSNVSP